MGFDLKVAKAWVESGEAFIVLASKYDAEQLMEKLQAAGADVEINEISA